MGEVLGRVGNNAFEVEQQAAHTFPAVVIGGSAGSLEALIAVVSELPADLRAAVFVIMHVPAASVSALPHILGRAGSLFATHAIDRAPIAPGRIIVAPPNHHLTLEDGVMRVLDGPTENNHRPSIDVTLRSAAASFSSQACGVVLSGTLDDGSAGLVAIHENGGTTFAQDPNDAQFSDMPANAIQTGAVDGIYPARELAAAITEWVNRPPAPAAARGTVKDEREDGVPSVFTCPDCSGILWELDEESVLRFRCRTGHAYSGQSMLSAHEHHLEGALWAAIRALEERRDLLIRLTARSKKNGDLVTTRRFERRFADVESDILQVRQALSGLFAGASQAQ